MMNGSMPQRHTFLLDEFQLKSLQTKRQQKEEMSASVVDHFYDLLGSDPLKNVAHDT